jgi:hypothetical protein
MDPLSITMAIVGLLTAAGKVGTLLGHLSEWRNAPFVIAAIRDEVLQTSIALQAIKGLLGRLEDTHPRRELIQVDHLRVTLANAMLTFSSLEELLLDVHILEISPGPSRSSPKNLRHLALLPTGHRKLKAIEDHLARIQRYKSSLTFMLTILQW